MRITYSEQMQRIANKYFAAGGRKEATAREIAAWAIDQSLWKPQQKYVIDRCAQDIADAMRVEHFTDPQGRSIRAKHAARIRRQGKQLHLWSDIRTADDVYMRVAFQQRRQHIVGECGQLKSDVDSYNQNREPEKPFQLNLDFTNDVIELELANKAA